MRRLGSSLSERAAELADEAYAICILDAPAHGHPPARPCTPV